MPVTITVTHETATGALDELRDLAAGLASRAPNATTVAALTAAQNGDTVVTGSVEATMAELNTDDDTAEGEAEAKAVAKRKRRTKAEIAADEAAAQAQQNRYEIVSQTGVEVVEASIFAAPEDRVNPDDEIVVPEIEDIPPAPGAELTLDDLRNVAGMYARKYNNDMVAAQNAAMVVFERLGVQSISKCPPDKIALVHAELLKAL
jgi:hypothetical protein